AWPVSAGIVQIANAEMAVAMSSFFMACFPPVFPDDPASAGVRFAVGAGRAPGERMSRRSADVYGEFSELAYKFMRHLCAPLATFYCCFGCCRSSPRARKINAGIGRRSGHAIVFTGRTCRGCGHRAGLRGADAGL